MKYYLKQNVYDAALERLSWIFDEFPNVIADFSGGKDSTAVLNLALMVAAEKKRLPLRVMFVDQEAEWECVIDYVRSVMEDPRVDPCWLQIPIKIFNATSEAEPWLYCWEEGREWMRDKEPNSIKTNRYGTDRFKKLFTAHSAVEYPASPVARLAGIRCEETPIRRMSLTLGETYKGITWGRRDSVDPPHYSFSPLYDWTLSDVWKAIHDNGWPYCRLYDYMYQYGVPLHRMRVSNVHHETALHQLFFLQEIEPDTWAKLGERIAGIKSAGSLSRLGFEAPTTLPFMFRAWTEYRDYLLEHLITDPAHRERFAKAFARELPRWTKSYQDTVVRKQIAEILHNDYEGTKRASYATASATKRHKIAWRRMQ